jgi:hypothetical protein
MSRLLRSPRNDGSTCEPCSSSNVGKKRGNSISGPEQRAENDRTSPVEETGRSSFTREFRLSPATSRVPHGDFFPVRASSRPRRSEQRASLRRCHSTAGTDVCLSSLGSNQGRTDFTRQPHVAIRESTCRPS